MKVYNKFCEKIDKKVLSTDELKNNEYVMKISVWILTLEGKVALFKSDSEYELYSVPFKYVTDDEESVDVAESIITEKLKITDCKKDLVFFERSFLELDNEISDIWLYAVKDISILQDFSDTLCDAEKMKRGIKEKKINRDIPGVNAFLNRKIQGRLYRNETMKDIFPYMHNKISDTDFSEYKSENQTKLTDSEKIDKIKWYLRAYERRLISLSEFYHCIRTEIKD